MRVRVIHTIGDLADDMQAITVRARPDMRAVVVEGIRVGKSLAQDNAKASAGPHGRRYYKRISSEMTGQLEGEFGPHDGGTPVGAGWRHDGPNLDLERAADVIGPAFYGEVKRLPDKWFW